jgi:hypothetical protein
MASKFECQFLMQLDEQKSPDLVTFPLRSILDRMYKFNDGAGHKS